jgi:hypothetical protein
VTGYEPKRLLTDQTNSSTRRRLPLSTATFIAHNSNDLHRHCPYYSLIYSRFDDSHRHSRTSIGTIVSEKLSKSIPFSLFFHFYLGKPDSIDDVHRSLLTMSAPTFPRPPTTPANTPRAPMIIATSIFDAEIDLSSKEGARLYEVGSAALPNTFSGHGKDIRVFINGLENRAKKCN